MPNSDHRGLSTATFRTAPADAKTKNVTVNKTVNVQRNVRVNRTVNVNRSVNRTVGTRFVVGERYNGHIWYGRSRHFWRGRWYAYGDGPCWMRIDGLWFWNEVACPI
jgi:hypothetical protein